MLSGATLSAAAMVGTAVFRIVVSSDSMKNATATSHGNNRRPESLTAGTSGMLFAGLTTVAVSFGAESALIGARKRWRKVGLRDLVYSEITSDLIYIELIGNDFVGSGELRAHSRPVD